MEEGLHKRIVSNLANHGWWQAEVGDVRRQVGIRSIICEVFRSLQQMGARIANRRSER